MIKRLTLALVAASYAASAAVYPKVPDAFLRTDPHQALHLAPAVGDFPIAYSGCFDLLGALSPCKAGTLIHCVLQTFGSAGAGTLIHREQAKSLNSKRRCPFGRQYSGRLVEIDRCLDSSVYCINRLIQ